MFSPKCWGYRNISPPGVVLRAANQNYHDCRWQSFHNFNEWLPYSVFSTSPKQYDRDQFGFLLMITECADFSWPQQRVGANPEDEGTGFAVRKFPQLVDSNARIGSCLFQCQVTFLPNGNFYHRQMSSVFIVFVTLRQNFRRGAWLLRFLLDKL